MEVFATIPVPGNLKEPVDSSLKESIWKTVQYVLRNGTTFEDKLTDKGFEFLRPENEYHEYYKFILEHMQEKDSSENASRKENHEPTEPFPFVFSTYASDVGPKELELIKTTAQFCVVNGDLDYLAKLREKYSDDSRFAFLKLDHSLNPVLTDFINQYEQILAKEYGPVAKVDGALKSTVLRRAFQRAEYLELRDEMKSKMKNSLEKLKVRFSAYEWDKFELLHTVSFEDTESLSKLPVAIDFAELSKKRLVNDIQLFRQKVEPGTSKRKKKNITIRKAGETRNGPHAVQKVVNYIKCPITGRSIPETEFDSHLRVLLSDPEYKEMRDKYEAKHKLSNLSTSEVYENIKRLVSTDTTNPAKRQKV